MPSTTAPPTSGPSATPRPEMPDQAPMARPRFSGAKAVESSVSVSGVTIAAPAPWRARAAISAPADGASAAPADAAVKMARPITNMRRRPKRSPSAAPVSSSTAKVSVYALTVHSRACRPPPSSARIEGRAVVTTRLSSTTMKRATETIANVQSGRMRDLGGDMEVRGHSLPSFVNAGERLRAKLVVTHLHGRIVRPGDFDGVLGRRVARDDVLRGVGLGDVLDRVGLARGDVEHVAGLHAQRLLEPVAEADLDLAGEHVERALAVV